MEKILEVRAFEVRYQCDEPLCYGAMVYNGRARQGLRGPEFQHVCRQCSKSQFLTRQFPTMVSIPINEEIPKEWHDKLVRDAVNNPPPEPGKIALS